MIQKIIKKKFEKQVLWKYPINVVPFVWVLSLPGSVVYTQGCDDLFIICFYF